MAILSDPVAPCHEVWQPHAGTASRAASNSVAKVAPRHELRQPHAGAASRAAESTATMVLFSPRRVGSRSIPTVLTSSLVLGPCSYTSSSSPAKISSSTLFLCSVLLSGQRTALGLRGAVCHGTAGLAASASRECGVHDIFFLFSSPPGEIVVWFLPQIRLSGIRVAHICQASLLRQQPSTGELYNLYRFFSEKKILF
jgi:hypothetical protein